MERFWINANQSHGAPGNEFEFFESIYILRFISIVFGPFWSSNTSFMVAILPPTLISGIIEPLHTDSTQEESDSASKGQVTLG